MNRSRNTLPYISVRGYSGFRRKVGGKQFYLGSDEQLALLLDSIIQTEWRRLQLAGVTTWPADVLGRIEAERQRLYQPASGIVEAIRPLVSPRLSTLLPWPLRARRD